MNFVVSSKTLLKHLQTISGVLTTNNTVPILENFLFELNGNTLEVFASDIETTMKTTLEVNANESGALCVPAKLLLDVLKSLSDEPLTFSISQDDFGIEITYTNGKSKMVGYDAEDFPRMKDLTDADSITITGEILSEAVSKTIFATGNDELRPVMSGVFFEFTEEAITFVATDAHKLVRYRRTDLKASKYASFIVPKKALNVIKNTVAGTEDEKVKLDYDSSNAVFSYGNIELTCRLIDGKYPNYEAVIPKENTNILTIDREMFYNVIRRISLFANKTTHQVGLKIEGSELTIFSEDQDFSNEAKERLTCSYNGENMEIGFNSRFLIDMLSNLQSENIHLKMSQPNRAGLIVPANHDNDNEDILMLVMPIMV